MGENAGRLTMAAGVFFIYGIWCGLVLQSHWRGVAYLGALAILGGLLLLRVLYLALKESASSTEGRD